MSILEKNQLVVGQVAFFLCDMQEKFQKAIDHFDEILEVCKRLVNASKILDLPLVVTEQYPKGLGSTMPDLDISHAKLKIEKTKFSMLSAEVREFLQSNSIKSVVLFGVETHICVMQTALELLKENYSVHLVADGCSSRSPTDRLFALDRLRQAGAVIVTYESILFQLVNDKNHEKFKEIQNIIKVLPSDTGLLKRTSSI